MRSKIGKKILEETPDEVRIFVRLYGDIVVRVHQLLRQKGWTQKELAARLEKKPSEISKWLGGDHNLTLMSLAKLHAELGSEIIYVPKRDSFHVQHGGTLKAQVAKADPISSTIQFSEAKQRTKIDSGAPIAA